MTPTSGHFYTHDALFNVTSMVDEATDSAVERYAYSPYGEATVLDASFTAVSGNSSAFDNELLYTGRRIDPATGLQLNRNRFYHQQLGRWVSRDPIGYDGGDMNLYGYVGGMPTYYVDPSGTVIETVWDAGNVGLGVGSFCFNVYCGNGWAAGEDAIGIVIDVGATCIPCVPGGAGAALKAKRACKIADKVKDIARGGDFLDDLNDAKKNFKKNKDFRDWIHRQGPMKDKIRGGGKDPGLTDDEWVEGWNEWNDLGKPGRGGGRR